MVVSDSFEVTTYSYPPPLPTVVQIQSDQKFDKKHEEHVSKGGQRIVSFSLCLDDVIISGDEASVNIAVKEDISIKGLTRGSENCELLITWR